MEFIISPKKGIREATKTHHFLAYIAERLESRLLGNLVGGFESGFEKHLDQLGPQAGGQLDLGHLGDDLGRSVPGLSNSRRHGLQELKRPLAAKYTARHCSYPHLDLLPDGGVQLHPGGVQLHALRLIAGVQSILQDETSELAREGIAIIIRELSA